MKIQQFINILAPLILISFFLHGRDPQPMNNQFNIGQDIITSYEYALFNFNNPYLFKKNGKTDTELNLSFSYGLTRSIGCTFKLPFAFYHEQNSTSRGLSDISYDMQWQFYRTDDQLFLMKAGMQFPTGDTNTRPSLGSGSFNPLLTLAALHSSERLFGSLILDANIATTRKQRNTGSSIDYEASIGPKFPIKSGNDGQIYTFLELQGFYCLPSKLRGIQVPDTGGHLVLVGPLISYDTDRTQYILQMLVPVFERRKGIQIKANSIMALSYQYNF